jgi:hypothetical protein
MSQSTDDARAARKDELAHRRAELLRGVPVNKENIQRAARLAKEALKRAEDAHRSAARSMINQPTYTTLLPRSTNAR